MLLTPMIADLLVVLFMALVIAAAVSDARSFRIPNWISLAVVGLFPIHVLVRVYGTETMPGAEWMYSVGIALIVLAVGLVMFARKYVGGGDVKLISAASLWAGPTYAFDLLLLTSIAGGVMALIMVIGIRPVLIYVCNICRLSMVSETLTANALPYGVAIAIGTTFVGTRLLAG